MTDEQIDVLSNYIAIVERIRATGFLVFEYTGKDMKTTSEIGDEKIVQAIENMLVKEIHNITAEK